MRRPLRNKTSLHEANKALCYKKVSFLSMEYLTEWIVIWLYIYVLNHDQGSIADWASSSRGPLTSILKKNILFHPWLKCYKRPNHVMSDHYEHNDLCCLLFSMFIFSSILTSLHRTSSLENGWTDEWIVYQLLFLI